MSFGQFVAFVDERADDEKWELVDGRPVLSPRPDYFHRMIVANVIVDLRSALGEGRWAVIPGIGVHVDAFNAPVPDVMVRPLTDLDGSFCNDIVVAFEVLSPKTARRDRTWKRRTYAALPALMQYVIVSPGKIEVLSHDRGEAFAERRLHDARAVLDMPSLGVALPLASLYRDTRLA